MITTACVAHEPAVGKASGTQAVGRGFEPRPNQYNSYYNNN